MEYLQFSFGCFHVASVARYELAEFLSAKAHTGLSVDMLTDIWHKCKGLTGGAVASPKPLSKKKKK